MGYEEFMRLICKWYLCSGILLQTRRDGYSMLERKVLILHYILLLFCCLHLNEILLIFQGLQTVDISEYIPEYPYIVDFCNLTQVMHFSEAICCQI